eukprot:11205252-Lingulodinium_polyedra.AAC.1
MPRRRCSTSFQLTLRGTTATRHTGMEQNARGMVRLDDKEDALIGAPTSVRRDGCNSETGQLLKHPSTEGIGVPTRQ